ncbi:LLM class flavin-dependent oxidoreductase [Nakamurella sp.]|uniref:LLM class flavin-dependent oxidoreductase n=1 Tax=Nakamurella sp. TaxID=1869182 RepID=UPI003B3BD0F7
MSEVLVATGPGTARPSGSLSVLLPFIPRRPEQVLPYAALVEWTAAERLWQGQALAIEPFSTFAATAGAGFRVPTGLAVTLMPLRHPFAAADLAVSLAMTTGESVVAGFGPGARSLQQSLLGEAYRSPLTATREYLTIVRELVAGRPVDVAGEYYTCRGRLPHVPTPRIDLGLGVLRSGMADLAGEVADLAITWLTPARYLAETIVPAAAAGAARAGRARPRITALVPAALRRPDRDPVDLTLGGSSAHLSLPHYQDMLRRAGIDVTGDDLTLDAKKLVTAGGFLYGDPEELAGQFRAYRAAGVDEIVLNLTGVFNRHGPRAAMDDLKTMLTAAAAAADADADADVPTRSAATVAAPTPIEDAR